MGRVQHHPILPDARGERFLFFFEGQALEAAEGETIAAALMANGIRSLRHTDRSGETRGVFCGIGQCSDCMMEVDQTPNVRVCVTPVRPGMRVNMQGGAGDWRRRD